MKRGIFQFIVCLLLFISCSPKFSKTYTKVPKNLINYFHYVPNRPPNISAHRGGGDLQGYPENCVESFEYLAKQMPVIIECDIELTKDSVMMMMHDNSLDRTTTGKGKIIDQTWANFKEVKLKDNFGNLTNYTIPTLERVLIWGRNKVLFTLDVKRNTPYEKVVEAVHKYKAENYAAIITYDEKQAKKVYDLDHNLVISVTIRNKEEYDRLATIGIPDRNMLAFIGTREPNKELCDFLHQKGICTILGTLGNLDKMAAAKGDKVYSDFIKNGADILSTDRFFEANKIITNSKNLTNP